MTKAATRTDRSATEAELKAAIEAEKRCLRIQLGGVLIVDLIAAGFCFARQACSWLPDSSSPGLSWASASFTDRAARTWMAGISRP